MYYKIESELISYRVSPQKNFDNVIDDIGVDYESKTHSQSHIDNLVWIVSCNVSVADSCDCVYSPVKRIEILYIPRLIYYVIPGS